MSKKFRPARPIYLLAALTIVAIAMLVTSFLFNLRARDLARAHRENNSLARMLMEQTEQSFSNADLALRGVQDRLQTPYGIQLGLDGPLVRLLLNTRIAGSPQVAKIFVADANGLVANSSDPETTLHRSVSDEEYFKLLSRDRETGLFISRPPRTRSTATGNSISSAGSMVRTARSAAS